MSIEYPLLRAPADMFSREGLKTSTGFSMDMLVDESGHRTDGKNMHTAVPSSIPANLKKETDLVTYEICGTTFQIPQTYTPYELLGQGAYGVVIAAMENRTGTKVAIKKIKDVFAKVTDAKRTLREVKLLRHFDHENIIGIRDMFKPPSKEEFNDVYIVSEIMETDLKQIINSHQPLSEDHAQYFIYQILRGLHCIHAAGVLHRDLKPGNLLCNQDCSIKIADFGLARIEEEDHMTEYVATRWYRAPEVICDRTNYTKAIDVWSVGCIFAELMLNPRRPLLAGTNYVDQIKRIIDLVGTPSEEDLRNISDDHGKRFLRSLPKKDPVPFETLFGRRNPFALDLLKKMLTFNPDKRITVEQALRHPYFENLFDPADLTLENAKPFDFDFEHWQLEPAVIKELIWKEILAYHPD